MSNQPVGITGPDPTGRDPAGQVRAPGDDRSIGTLFGEISNDLSTLIRQEMALAKAEATQSATKVGTGAGLLGAAVMTTHLFLTFLSVAVWWGLGNHIGRGWSGLIVAIIWAVITVALALAGRAALRKVRGLPQTTDTVGKIPAAIKGHEEDNR